MLIDIWIAIRDPQRCVQCICMRMLIDICVTSISGLQGTRTNYELISVLQRAWLLPKDGGSDPVVEAKFGLDSKTGDEGTSSTPSVNATCQLIACPFLQERTSARARSSSWRSSACWSRIATSLSWFVSPAVVPPLYTLTTHIGRNPEHRRCRDRREASADDPDGIHRFPLYSTSWVPSMRSTSANAGKAEKEGDRWRNVLRA